MTGILSGRTLRSHQQLLVAQAQMQWWMRGQQQDLHYRPLNLWVQAVSSRVEGSRRAQGDGCAPPLQGQLVLTGLSQITDFDPRLGCLDAVILLCSYSLLLAGPEVQVALLECLHHGPGGHVVSEWDKQVHSHGAEV